MSEAHEITPDGESTANWAINQPGFGGIEQLTRCARCGERLPGNAHTPHKVRDIFKPTMHFLCDECHEALPE